jgi:hypothetical protein
MPNGTEIVTYKINHITRFKFRFSLAQIEYLSDLRIWVTTHFRLDNHHINPQLASNAYHLPVYNRDPIVALPGPVSMADGK